MKYLLQYQPDIEVPGGLDNDTPLLLATKRKRVGIVYELIKHDAKLSSVDRVKNGFRRTEKTKKKNEFVVCFRLVWR